MSRGTSSRSPALPHIQSGALRALGVTATARLRVLPDVPLIGDAVPGYTVTGWLGIGAPKGTPTRSSIASTKRLTRRSPIPL